MVIWTLRLMRRTLRKAEDEAGNYSFSEHTSEYEAQGASKIMEVKIRRLK